MKKRIRYLVFRSNFLLLLLWLLSMAILVTFSLIMMLMFQVNIWIGAVLPLAGIGIGMYGIYVWYWRPLQETRKVLKLFAEGYFTNEVFDLKHPLCPEMEDAVNKCKDIMKGREWIKYAQKQSEYLALQNQINPHFLYNTLEGIRGEALMAGMDSIAEMTEALATFFQYTISQMDHLVTLEDELANVENYFIIQQFRFGNRLNLKIELSEYDEDNDVMRYRLPKLTLQPLVENAIFHGIERKIGAGTVTIRIQPDASHLNITVSDDGVGIDGETLQRMNEKFHKMSFEDEKETYQYQGSGSGIAINNVNNRIKLLFGEEYGIHIYSLVGTGTDVEITLPLMEA